MWLQTTNQPSQILHDGVILGYADSIAGQYVFRLKKTLKSPVFINSADTKPKETARPENIELWHLRMGHLGYKSLIALKNLSSGIDFKATTLSKLCKNCQKGNKTCQPSKSSMFRSTEFLGCVHSDLKGPFPRMR